MRVRQHLMMPVPLSIFSDLDEDIKSKSKPLKNNDVPIPHFKPIPILLPIPAFKADTDTDTADTTDTFLSIEHHQ